MCRSTNLGGQVRTDIPRMPLEEEEMLVAVHNSSLRKVRQQTSMGSIVIAHGAEGLHGRRPLSQQVVNAQHCRLRLYSMSRGQSTLSLLTVSEARFSVSDLGEPRRNSNHSSARDAISNFSKRTDSNG